MVAFHRLTVADVRRETPEAVSVAFAVPPELAEAYRFTPGQHLTLRKVFDGVEQRRSYSICTGLDDQELRIAVKKAEGGLFSAYINDALKVGDEIEVMTPQGRFGLMPDPARARTVLAVAAGSGVTPVMSLLRSILAREPRSRVVLVYGNRTSQSIIFKEALEDLKDRYLDRLAVYHVLSREKQDIELLDGRIDHGKLERMLTHILPAAEIDHAFICGPGGLIEETKTTLVRLGVPAQRVHVEYFTPDGSPGPARAELKEELASALTPIATAHIVLFGTAHAVPVMEGESIIDAGLRQGIEMPYSCRAGMCCTCRAKLVAGEVEMMTNYSLEAWEIDAGFVLTCQSHPRTRTVVLDYDQL